MIGRSGLVVILYDFTGTIGANLSALSDLSDCSITSRLAIIAGTSSCHMAVS